MSYDPYFNSSINQITNGDSVRFDDNQYFTNYAEINAITTKYQQITYIALDTGNRYRWNGTSLILINSGSGSVFSVTGGNQTSITGTANDPIINVVTSPTFVNVTSSSAASSNNHLIRKIEAETAINAVQTNLDNHINDTSGAHAASAISYNIGSNQYAILPDVQNSMTQLDGALVTLNSNKMDKSSNLSDVTSVSQSRTNLQVYSTSETNTQITNTLNTHISNPTNAHQASAISTVAGSNIHATTLTVQGDINALDNAISSIVVTSALNDLTDVDDTGKIVGNTIVYNGSSYITGQTYSTFDISSTVLFNADFNSNPNDNSTYATPGTIVGSVTSTAGKIGNAYNFPGSNAYIKYGYQSRLNFTVNSQFSLNFWLRSSATGSTKLVLISQAESPNGSGWNVEMQPLNSRIEIAFMDVASARQLNLRWEGLPNLVNNTWNFITITKQPGVTQDKCSLYYNSVLRDDLKTTLTANLLITDNIQVAPTVEFNIGSRNNGEASEYIGIMDNVQILSIALVPSMVTSFYNSDNGLENNYTVQNIFPHLHQQSEIIGLESRLTTNESNIASKVASVSSGNSNIQMFGTATAPIVTLQDTLTSLVSVTTGTISTTSGSITTAPTTSNHIVNKSYCDRTTKNLLSDINLQIFTFPASNFIPNSTTLSANESLTVNLNTGSLNTNNYLCAFQGYGSPQKAFHSLSTQQRTFFAVKLTGSNWAGHEMGNCRIGWATRDWFGFSESNITSSTSLLALTWNTSNTSANKGYTMSFFGSSGFLIYNGSSNSVTRTNFTIANSVAQQNDILIASFVPSSNSFITYWYRGGVLGCQSSGTYPSGDANSNFTASNIVPVFTPASSGTNYQFQVLSSRDFAAEGITLSNHVNYFY
ncbi:hypothetical protein EKK58_04375 [Candidatus Dependentiae bacterium]|nr:MAG: hypothetical protein EKK58_04375 [Candidatus Dependentiae bacterium]